MPDEIKFANYIIERIKQSGVKQVFGVPGDYNLDFLDFFEEDPVLEWVGNANELNAAYAADGYARVKGGLAVVVTTFGVGELSALCGMAGCLAERIPVLHIVGAPSTKMQKDHALLHHTLNTSESFKAFSNMSKPLSCSQALINDVAPNTPTAWTEAFDNALRNCLTQCRPAYVELPMNAIHQLVSAEGLSKPLPLPHSEPPYQDVLVRAAKGDGNAPPSSLFNLEADKVASTSDEMTKHIVELIAGMFAKAKKPVVLVDACAERFGVGKIVRHLVESCDIRAFTTPMGKGILDERSPLYGGCYAGSNSLQAVKDEVESADFVLYVGSLKSDFNSGSFSVRIDTAHSVKLHSYTTNVGYATYPTTDLRHIVPLLAPAFQKVIKTQVNRPPAKKDTMEEKEKAGLVSPLYTKPNGDKIVQAWLWQRLGSWFQDDDIIITETGTSSFGLLPVPIPSHATYVAQILWGSIGWSVGCTLGVALAAKERKQKPRTVLFVGDGSLQLTVQEIGTMIRRGLCPYLFVLNNDGYEIERQIHGAQAKYNDIQPYDHQMLLEFFGAKKCKAAYQSYDIYNQQELDQLLNDPDFAKPDRIRLIELHMPRGDAPVGLINQAKLTAKANAGD